jgi:uncharacterized membrane protein
MRDWHDVSHMGWVPGTWLVVALILVALIAFALGAVARSAAPDTPEQILKRRLAGGEITADEYERTLAELRQ